MLVRDKIWLIGDPHFGRNFQNGTPLHRRGDREKMQREQFIEELNTPAVHTVVMVGDLFDKPFVPLSVLSQVINDVLDAALARPDVTFVYMAGNHDISRQIGAAGAWHIFELAVGWKDNIEVLNEPKAIGGVTYYPWQWELSAEEQVDRYGSVSCWGAVGHWDMMSFGGDDSHMAPVKKLRELNPDVQIYSGHYHEEGVYVIDGATVDCTGSLQPYAHGEGDMYVTLTLDEALAQADELRDKCVRVILQPGESLPDIDCLQLTQKRADVEEVVELSEIGLGTFSLADALETAMNDNRVPDQIRTFIKERLGAVG